MSHKKLIPYTTSELPLKKLHPSVFKKQLLKTRTALSAYEKLLNTIPHPETILSSLSVLEALAAVESQKITLPLEDFFLLGHTHPILSHYHTALKQACHSTAIISKHMLCAIHRSVKKGAPKHMEVGKYRTAQNWIGPEGCTREEAYFFPPTPEKVPSSMHNLIVYANHEEKDPLVQIALIIAQFLIIHPFRDGNGRVARILVPWLLYKKRALPHPLLFYSRYLKDYRNHYFRKLFDITRKNRWEQWVRFFLKGIATAAHNEKRKAQKIYLLLLTLEKKLKKRHAPLSFLFSHPVFPKAEFLKHYSHAHFNELKALKIIAPFKKGHYVFPALLTILKKKPRKATSSRG